MVTRPSSCSACNSSDGGRSYSSGPPSSQPRSPPGSTGSSDPETTPGAIRSGAAGERRRRAGVDVAGQQRRHARVAGQYRRQPLLPRLADAVHQREADLDRRVVEGDEGRAVAAGQHAVEPGEGLVGEVTRAAAGDRRVAHGEQHAVDLPREIDRTVGRRLIEQPGPESRADVVVARADQHRRRMLQQRGGACVLRGRAVVGDVAGDDDGSDGQPVQVRHHGGDAFFRARPVVEVQVAQVRDDHLWSFPR